MLSRRAFVGKLAAGTAAACAVGIGGAKVASARAEATATSDRATGNGQPGHAPEAGAPDVRAPEIHEVPDASGTLSAPAPWELLRPLALGSQVARGWRVSELTGVVDGSCVLTLQNQKGRAHRIHLCRNDGQPQGLVYTDQLDLVIMNGGQGDLPTDEGLAQAVAEVAHVLAANEGERRHQAVVAALLPHAARVAQFAAAPHARLR